jgi:hypothetical protein
MVSNRRFLHNIPAHAGPVAKDRFSNRQFLDNLARLEIALIPRTIIKFQNSNRQFSRRPPFPVDTRTNWTSRGTGCQPVCTRPLAGCAFGPSRQVVEGDRNQGASMKFAAPKGATHNYAPIRSNENFWSAVALPPLLRIDPRRPNGAARALLRLCCGAEGTPH